MAKSKNKSSRFWYYLKRIFIVLFVAQFIYIIILRWVNPPITITQAVSYFRGNGLNRDYIAYENMGSNAKLAILAGEDQQFPDHNGFDIKAIKLAMKYNKKHPTKIRGASTLSQQVAKNVFLWQHGGYFRKGLEVYFTFMIETFWGKERILEMYLNVAEMGKGVFGIEAASQSYFNKDAKSLGKMEAAQIGAALPNPVRFTIKPQSKYVAIRSVFIAGQMTNISDDEDIKALIK